MNLSEYDKKILDALDTVGGFTTGGVARRVTPKFGNNRQHSGAIRSWLANLEKKGLVKRMDDQKPVCWMKVSNAALRGDSGFIAGVPLESMVVRQNDPTEK